MTLPDLHTVPVDGDPPFEPDAVVREEDTWLVLGAPGEPEPPDEPPETLLREAADHEPRTPGTVVVRDGSPVELLAVVHDLDREPTCRPEWVDAALEAVMEELHRLGAETVVLPVLGAVHGTLHPLRFHRSLRSALEDDAPWALRAICLRVPRGVDPRTIRDIERLWEAAES